MLFLNNFGAWLATNKTAQAVIAAIGTLALFRFWLWRHDTAKRKEWEFKAKERERELLETIKENSNDFTERAEKAVVNVPVADSFDELPKHIRDRLRRQD